MDAKQLRQVELFQQMSLSRLERLAAYAEGERQPKGAVLFRQGEPAKTMWVVLEGWIHLLRSGASSAPERGVVIFTITPDEALCGISSLGAGRYHVSAVTGTACRMIRIPAEVFSEALRHEPAMAYAALQLCVRRLQHIAEQYGSMNEPVLHRLLRTLLRLEHQFGTTLPVTHRELAQMSWTTTESAIRTVRRLKTQGYLRGRRGQLTLVNRSRLAQLMEGSNGRASV